MICSIDNKHAYNWEAGRLAGWRKEDDPSVGY